MPPPDWLPNELDGAWNLFAGVPPLLAAAVVVTGILLALCLRTIPLFWGRRLSARFGAEFDDRVFRLTGWVLALLVTYGALIAAVRVLPLSPTVSALAARGLLTLLVLQLLRSGLQLSHLALDGLSRIRDRYPVLEERTLPLFELAATLAGVGAAAYALLRVWNFDITPWLASAGVLGIALGFAARETLANLFAGVSIIADAPYKIGDYIVLESGERGEITRVGMRSTRLITRDDIEITVPNSEMASNRIFNESGGRWQRSRVRVKVPVAYTADPDAVVTMLEDVAQGIEEVCAQPTPRVRLRALGADGFEFELLAWVELPADRGRIRHLLAMEVFRRFRREGIELPVAELDVLVRRNEANPGEPAGPAPVSR